MSQPLGYERQVHSFLVEVHCSAVAEQVRVDIGRDFFVLPSSIHELILLPDKVDYERKELDELVRQVNSQCVEAEDFLSDHAYYYNAQKDRIEF